MPCWALKMVGFSSNRCSGPSRPKQPARLELRPAWNPGALEHLGRHAGFTPGRIGDAFAIAVRPCCVNELFLEGRDVLDRTVLLTEPGAQIMPRLDEMEALQRVG